MGKDRGKRALRARERESGSRAPPADKMIKRQISYIIFTLMLPYRNLWEGRDLCGRVCAPRGLILRAGALPRTGKLPCPLSVHPDRVYSRGPEWAHARATSVRDRGAGDRKELCIKTLYVRDRLCQQPLSCVRNASCRRAMLASTHSRCNIQSPGATRQRGCCRIVLSYSVPLAAIARLPQS